MENLHITTKFIGEWPEGRLEDLKSALDAIPRRGVFPVALRGLGWFPNPHAPRMFWVPVEGGDALRNLAADTDAALTPLGIAAETRTYTPHLTLARIPPGSNIAELRRQVARQPVAEWGTFEVQAFHLYVSQTGPSGSNYSKVHSISM